MAPTLCVDQHLKNEAMCLDLNPGGQCYYIRRAKRRQTAKSKSKLVRLADADRIWIYMKQDNGKGELNMEDCPACCLPFSV